MKLSQQELSSALRLSWWRKSSTTPDLWTPENRHLGQAAATSLVIQDVLSCDIRVRTIVGPVDGARPSPVGEHYVNVYRSNPIDLSDYVLPHGHKLEPNIAVPHGSERAHLLAKSDVSVAYESLLNALRVNGIRI